MAAPPAGDAPLLALVTTLPAQGPTGVQSHLGSVARAAAAWGSSTVVVHPWDGPQTLRRIVTLGGRVVAPFSREWSLVWLRMGFRALLRRRARWVVRTAQGRPAVLYAQEPLAAQAAIAVRQRTAGVRVVAVAHYNVSELAEHVENDGISPRGPVQRSLERAERDMLGGADLVVLPSGFSERALRDRTGPAFRAPSVVIAHAVEEPAPAAGSERGTRGDLISIGTLEPRKNHAFLLDVLSRLHAAGYPLRLTLVGDGPERERLERTAARLGLAEAVTFAGRVVPAAPLIAGHRVYVHASRMESFGLALVEAMACGRPVFAPAVGAVAELLRDGREGRLWDLEDPDAAAGALVELFADAALERRMGAAARHRYLTCYAPDAVTPRLRRALLGPPAAVAATGGR